MNEKSSTFIRRRATICFKLLCACVSLLLLEAQYVRATEQEGGGNLLSVRGVVVDTKEPPTPLVGATIIVKGTPAGTTTDGSGFFSIKAKKGDLLVVSYLGYQTKEVRVNSSISNMSIALAEDATALEQVVVTGMTSQAKVKIASSVGIVENTNFTNKPITRLSQALQGGTTGVFDDADRRCNFDFRL